MIFLAPLAAACPSNMSAPADAGSGQGATGAVASAGGMGARGGAGAGGSSGGQGGGAGGGDGGDAAAASDAGGLPFESLTVEVLEKLPHNPRAFTQGLELVGGRLYESTGLYGQSSVREVELTTGAVVRNVPLASNFFGEGLTVVDQRVIQLTWQEGTAFIYDRAMLTEQGTFSYTGEGWGLCYDGSRIVMSDGTGTLQFRDTAAFQRTGQVTVNRPDSVVVSRLNELECVGGSVYANVWMTDQILRIEPSSGTVTGVVDAAGLLSASEAARADVLNGIAHDSTNDTFLVTGKLWPWIFRVRFVSR